MKTRFFVQFQVDRRSDGTPRRLVPKSLTQRLPSIHYDGVVIGFDADIPDTAFRVPIVQVGLQVNHVGLPQVESLPIGVPDEENP